MRLNSRLAGGCALLREAALAAAGPGLDGGALRACLAHPVPRGGRGGRQGPRSAAPSEDVSENLFPVSSKSVTNPLLLRASRRGRRAESCPPWRCAPLSAGSRGSASFQSTTRPAGLSFRTVLVWLTTPFRFFSRLSRQPCGQLGHPTK